MTKSHNAIYEKINELVTLQLTGDAQDADTQALRDLVTGDPEARRIYVQYIQELYHIASRLSSPIHNAALDGLPANPSQTAASSSEERPAFKDLISSSKKLLLMATAAMLLLSGVVFWGVRHDSISTDSIARTKPGEPSANSALASGNVTEVATLVHGSGMVCDAASGDVSELTRLKIGQNLCLLEGSAEMVFDSGVEAIALAPCQLTIESAEKVSAKHGRITARVGESGKGFIIETAVARVTDLGTAFGIDVKDTGETSVAVFEGSVDLEYGSSKSSDGRPVRDKKNRLTQGEGLRINQFGVSSRLFSVDSATLPQVRQSPPLIPGHSVISAVVDNIDGNVLDTRNFYRIVRSGLREDCQAFVDRVHQWNGVDAAGIPEYLIGADYVMPFNDDKFIPDLEVVLYLERPATVYVFLSDDEVVPGWLTVGFVDTGQDIGLDEGLNRFRSDLALDYGPGKSIDTVFSIWKREVVSPLNVSLGPVRKPAKRVLRNGVKILPGYNMYGISAVAL